MIEHGNNSFKNDFPILRRYGCNASIVKNLLRSLRLLGSEEKPPKARQGNSAESVNENKR